MTTHNAEDKAYIRVHLSGTYCALDAKGRAVLLTGEGPEDEVFLPVFTTQARLREFLTPIAKWNRVQPIHDEREFLSSVRALETRVTVVLDPFITPEGRVRYLEIQQELDA